MAFDLPFPPFPHDSRDVPFIATPDDNNGYAVPSSQYFKKLVGEKYLWTPVSSTDPLPSSDAAAQAKLADILTKLSADPATQTTLAQILAKIIAAPATEAKQDTIIGHVDGVEGTLTALNGKDFATQTTLAAILNKIIAAPATEAKQTALNALIGEAQAAPTANTMLARLKSLEDKIDAITSGTTPAVTQLSGRNIEKVYFWNAAAITTKAAFSTLVDLSKYKDVKFYAYSTLKDDSSADISYLLNFNRIGNEDDYVFYWNGSAWTSLTFTGITGGKKYLNSLLDVSKIPNFMGTKVQMKFTCSSTPVSGALTVYAEGVPN